MKIDTCHVSFPVTHFTELQFEHLFLCFLQADPVTKK